MSRSRLVVLALTLALAPACAHAPGLASGGGPGGAPFAASPADLLAAAKAAGRPGDAQTVSLFEGVHYTVDAQGREVWDLWRILQVHTDDAVRAHGILRVGYEPSFQDKPLVEARVITSDGVVHRLDPTTLSVRGSSDDADQEIDGGRDLVAPLPAVAPGAVIEEHVRITDRAVLDPGGAYGRYLIGDRIPVEATRIELDAPASVPLHYLVAGLPKVHPHVTTHGGRTHLVLTVGPQKAVDDLESDAPADLVQWPYFAFSTGKSWQSVATVYAGLVDRQIAGADLKAQVAQAVAGAKGRRARIDRILSRLSRRIRYTGIELGQGAIVPRTPAQTLARGFGDCKDKAALLVAWLRAAGIPAHVALLDVGDRHDVDPALPALGPFDHAIVYVPGTPALWIDPTARERAAGSLPSGDSGRLALVAAPTTTALVRVPAARPADNVFSDHRELVIPQEGWAKMTLKRTFTGRFAATYRSALAKGSEKRLHQHLEGFVKRRFQAKALDRLTHGPLDDLEAPVTVTLELDHAGRGRSDGIESAVAAVQDESLFDFLPDYLTDAADASAPERKAELILPEPYRAEIHYRIVPPAGMSLRPLPRDDGFTVGPARFSRHYHQEASGVVTVTERFDTGDGHLTPHQARELHLKVHEEMNHRPRMVYFELKPAAELAAGKVQQAFADYRKLAHTPPTALDAVRMAEGLRRFGLGGLARTWARKATVLDPESLLAWAELGRTLTADPFGRAFHRGMDRKGALDAYQHALRLDATAMVHQNLAALYERNDRGQTFGPGADLDQAVVHLRAARKLDPSFNRDVALMSALIHDGKYAEAVKVGEKARASHRRNLLLLSAVALHDGIDAARARAARLADDGSPSLLLMQTTGALLAFRAYPQALALAQTLGFDRLGTVGTLLANAGDRLKRQETVKPAAGPVGLVAALVPHAAGDSAGDLHRWLLSRISRRLPPAKLYPGFFRMPGADASSLGVLATAVPGLMGDLVAAVSVVKDDGVAGGVHRVQVTAADSGDDGVSYYVVHEGKADRLLCSGMFTAPLGHDALAALDAGHLDDARKLLDWAYDGSASPMLLMLAENPMPELWAKDKPRTAEAARRAALALVALGPHPQPALAPLERLLAHTPKKQGKLRDALALALATGASAAGQSARAVRLAREVVARHDEAPYRRMALAFAQSAKGTGPLKTLLKLWGKTHADELAVILAREAVAVRSHHFPAAVKALQAAIADGKENPVIDNELANFALFGQLDLARGLKLAEKAVRGSDRKDAASLNTLAAVQATQGQDTVALRTLLEGMALHEDGRASPSDWYVVGLIQEHLGFPGAAARAYARVAKDPQAASPESYWVLAKRRLAALKAKGVKVSAAAAAP